MQNTNDHFSYFVIVIQKCDHKSRAKVVSDKSAEHYSLFLIISATIWPEKAHNLKFLFGEKRRCRQRMRRPEL